MKIQNLNKTLRSALRSFWNRKINRNHQIQYCKDDMSSQSKRCPNATQTFQPLRQANPLVRNGNLPQVLGCAETNHRLVSLFTRWMKAVVVDPTIRNQSYVDFRIVNPVHRSFCLKFQAGLSTWSIEWSWSLYLFRSLLDPLSVFADSVVGSFSLTVATLE